LSAGLLSLFSQVILPVFILLLFQKQNFH